MCISPAEVKTEADESQANPFGLMLGADGMDWETRLAKIGDLRAVYFRPNSIFNE